MTISIALIDTRSEAKGTLGTLISTHHSMMAGFSANRSFQRAMRKRSDLSIRTKLVRLRVRLALGSDVHPSDLAASH
jgi:hypothetical protein